MRTYYRFLSRYGHCGIVYRCILYENGKKRTSRWKSTQFEALQDAMFWHDYYKDK